jgi:hypothetical protein
MQPQRELTDQDYEMANQVQEEEVAHIQGKPY